jgi:dipeptidyl aminopeptidase/acylaminoacyl peptidase
MKLRSLVWSGGVVVFCALAALGLWAEEKRTAKPEDFVDIRGVSDVQISPDGKWVAFVVTEPADPKKPEKPRDPNIWLVPADGSASARLFAASGKSDTSPRWSPDGRSLAFLSNRGEPIGEEKEARNQIYLLRTDGGEAEQLTWAKGGVNQFKWSRDAAFIAFTSTDPPTEEEEKKKKMRDDAVYADHDYKYARLWVLTLADRKAEQVTRQDFHVSEFAMSPDGRELALRVARTPRLDDVFWQASLVVVRRLTGEVVRTLSESSGGFFDWSPDGQTIAFAEYTPARISSWLAVAPASGGPARYILKDYRGTLWNFSWAPDSKTLLAESQEGTKAKFLSLDTASGALTRLADVIAPGPAFSVSADGRTIAYLQQAGDSPTEVWALTLGQSPRRLTGLHPQMASLRLGEVKEITWKNKKDGQTIYGVLITPPDFKPGQRYPTVVQVHGGPQWAWWSGWHGSWHEWGQLLASNGYVVFLPNPRGSTGQGWQFAEANRDDWGGGDLEDIQDGVDSLIEQKIADPERLGIGGWSYGGFMTSWTVTQTNRFKAAVVGAAVTNLFSFNGTTDITPSFLRNYFLDIPFRRRQAYDTHSAMTFLQNCKTPSLVLHGEADLRVPVSQGWEFYNGLKALGVETEMVVYPREPHGIGERAHQLDLLKRVLAWYDKHLKK